MYVHRDKRGGVILTPEEAEITDLFLAFIVEGEDIPHAARYALSALPHPDPRFAAWLTQGMLSHEQAD
jgi:hypothetical protein